MFLFSGHTILLSTNVLLFCLCVVSADEVPAVLWNIKGDAMQEKPVSALQHDDAMFVETLETALKNDANILLYAVNKLSLEDFSASEKPLSSNDTLKNLQIFLDTQNYMMMSSVKDPMKHVHEFHCGIQEIVVDKKIDQNILQSVSTAFQRSCITVLHITDSLGTLGKEEIRNVFLPPLENHSKNIIGIFTGVKSSWVGSAEQPHIARNLLATEEAEANEKNFINVNGCLIMYAENGTLLAANKTISLPMSSVNTEGSQCSNSSALLTLNFKLSEEFSTVVVKFNFSLVTGSWVAEANVETTGGKSNVNEQLVNKDMSAPVGFSFSCGKLDLRSKNASRGVKLTINRFQVQPFGVKNAKRFDESFDCVTWFTIPIWMGIFVSLLFIAITNCGIFALYSVKTMDRFDDPKGKTITVAAAVD